MPKSGIARQTKSPSAIARAREICTIGYEGAELLDFIATLKKNGVTSVLDIRDAPISRKKGFSKSALQSALQQHGLRYEHLKGLGTPKAGREAARAGDRAAFLDIYKVQMATAQAKRDLQRVKEIGAFDVACLMCFERDHQRCHRDVVATWLARNAGFAVRHLEVPQ